jgi:MtrB/PioB family decaheme-associated outer membrane protein
LRLTAELKYQDRDNRTPVDTYNYIVLDSDSFTGTATNRPYSYTNNRFNLDANYRFNAITSLRGGYKYNEMRRSYTNAERAETQENTLFAKWKVKARSNIDIALAAETSKRDGSDYNTQPNENPAMRKYNLADRNRDSIGASIDYMATDKLFLSLKADYNKDDYENSSIGLTEATQPVYTVDFSYQPRHNITSYGYYTYENIYSSQTSQDVSASSATTNWGADFNDTFNTVGIGAKITDLGKWDVGADFLYSKSSGSIDMQDTYNPGTENQYPDTKTTLTSLKLWTSYDVSRQLSYKLGYRYERYSADNWAIDGLQPYDPLVAADILLLGNEALDYDVHVITASASYRF